MATSNFPFWAGLSLWICEFRRSPCY